MSEYDAEDELADEEAEADEELLSQVFNYFRLKLVIQNYP